MAFDILPVLIAAVLSALIWNFFFIPPIFTFHIDNAEDLLMFLMYFVIALVNAVLTFKIREQENIARDKEEKENTIKLYNTLLNSLSHELRTPISTIIGASDTLRDSDTNLSTDNKRELINEISIASLRLNDEVENLLNMSRLETGQLRLKKDWCDMNELIYSAVNRLHNKVGKHKIEIVLDEKFPLFNLDFGIMQQVLYNLLNNAIQYTPDETVITIHAQFTASIFGHFDETNLEEYRDSTSHKLMIIVSDNGKGFPENEIEKVFNKFYRTHNARSGGTGLGLSIVKGFIEAHNGTIELSNIPSGGAEFVIEIPTETSYLNNLKND